VGIAIILNIVQVTNGGTEKVRRHHVLEAPEAASFTDS
jgi:hypothetical protein